MASKPARILDDQARQKLVLAKRLLLYAGIVFAFLIIVLATNVLFSRTVQLDTPYPMQRLQAFHTPIDIEVLIVAFLFILLVGSVLIIWRHWVHVQKKQAPPEGDLSKGELLRAIQIRYQKRFWISFALYSTIMVLAIIVFFILKDSRIWYEYEPWYDLLAALKTVFPFLLILVWVGGAFVLLFAQWRQSASDIVGLVDSIKQMQLEEERNAVEVPHNLQELQPVLQNIFDKSLENRRAAQDAEQRKNDLIAYLAHDLKTPLTSVIGYLSLVAESGKLTHAQEEEYLGIARQKAISLESLIDQLFEISRFNMRDFELAKAQINIGLLLTQLVEEFYPQTKNLGKKIKLTIEDDLHIYGDADKLARVFSNVLKNALTYSPAESIIEIKASSSSKGIQVTITNQGVGIPQDRLDDIFKKFYRLDKARASNTGGSGLGLAIAKEIVERHGGMISAKSNRGETSFLITLHHPDTMPQQFF